MAQQLVAALSEKILINSIENMQIYSIKQMDQFANFLTSEHEGSFSNINFNVVEFCDDDFYGWKFPTPTYVKNKISEKLCLTSFDNQFFNFLSTIYASNLSCAEKIITFRLGAYLSPLKNINRNYISIFMINCWGRLNTKIDNVKCCSRAISNADKSKELDVLCNLKKELHSLKIVPSWSKAISAFNPSRYFVYDSRISLVLRFFWSVYQNYLEKHIQNPFVYTAGKETPIKNKKQGRFSTSCLPNIPYVGNQINNNSSLCNDELRLSSYLNYCYLITKISELLTNNGTIFINDEQLTEIKSISHTSSFKDEYIKTLISRQMVEIALFSLLGRDKRLAEESKTYHKTSYYFKRSKMCENEASITKGFDLSNMEQLKKLLNIAHAKD